MIETSPVIPAMSRRIWVVAATFLIAIPSGHADAQAATDSAASGAEATAKARNAVQRFPQQSRIRTRSGGMVIEGLFSRLSRDTLWITRFDAPEVGLPLRNVGAIWSRENSVARGALAGGLLGALALGTLGAAIESSLDAAFCEPVNCEKRSGSTVPFAVAVGGFGGAIAGLLIGRNIKRWQSRYP